MKQFRTYPTKKDYIVVTAFRRWSKNVSLEEHERFLDALTTVETPKIVRDHTSYRICRVSSEAPINKVYRDIDGEVISEIRSFESLEQANEWTNLDDIQRSLDGRCVVVVTRGEGLSVENRALAETIIKAPTDSIAEGIDSTYRFYWVRGTLTCYDDVPPGPVSVECHYFKTWPEAFAWAEGDNEQRAALAGVAVSRSVS